MEEHENTAPNANPLIPGAPAPVEEPLVESGTVASHEPAAPVEGALQDLVETKRILEAALLSASEPLQANDLRKLFDTKMSHDALRILLEEIREEWSERAVELTMVANGWRFRVQPKYQRFLDRLNPEKPPRYSRAVLETLAIIAYRQPATRGDIEDIRGVAVSPGILKALEERGWIDVIGHKDVPGRPALFATTKKFLDDLNLRSLEELPPLAELQATLDMTAAPPSAEAGSAALTEAGDSAPGSGTEDAASPGQVLEPEAAGESLAGDADSQEAAATAAGGDSAPQADAEGSGAEAPGGAGDGEDHPETAQPDVALAEGGASAETAATAASEADPAHALPPEALEAKP